MKTVNLDKRHQRGSFDSDTPLLDEYIKKQASQDVKRGLSACYVLIEEENVVVGYYTLSSNAIPQEDLPEEFVAKLRLPKNYADAPAILLGRLAVDKRQQGKRYGEQLLIEALERCLELSGKLGVLAVIVDPIDERAVSFYQRYGFILLPGSGKMFIPIKTIRELFGS